MESCGNLSVLDYAPGQTELSSRGSLFTPFEVLLIGPIYSQFLLQTYRIRVYYTSSRDNSPATNPRKSSVRLNWKVLRAFEKTAPKRQSFNQLPDHGDDINTNPINYCRFKLSIPYTFISRDGQCTRFENGSFAIGLW